MLNIDVEIEDLKGQWSSTRELTQKYNTIPFSKYEYCSPELTSSVIKKQTNKQNKTKNFLPNTKPCPKIPYRKNYPSSCDHWVLKLGS